MPMNMKYPIDLQKRIYSSIVPVECGNEKGTAFFVTPDTLVTARHVVADKEMNDSPVLISTKPPVLCDVIYIAAEGDNIDVVLLKCRDYQQNDSLRLLAAEFNEERQLTITGYPKEFGNCTELISIEVRDRLGTPKEDYDSMVVRTDALAFTSYKGFSGSPVLNESGSVIGVVVNQYSGSLGYVSIKSLGARLENIGVEVYKDWQSEDFSPCGRGTSQRQVEKAISYAALRYNKVLHVVDANLDAEIDLFAKIESRNEIEKNLEDIESIVLGTIFSFTRSFKKYKKGCFEELFDILYKWREEHDEKDMDSKTIDFYKEIYSRIYPLIEQWKRAKNQFLQLKGTAGMGKTHYVCATAERLCKDMNVYLLFGSRFTETLDFETQLCEMMYLKGNDIKRLNNEMLIENTNALIIIDALNEGATENFWNVALRRLKFILKDCDRVKVLTTYREGDGSHFDFPCETIELKGFEDSITQEAVKKYFDFYQIDDEEGTLRQKYQMEFKEPLFLSMFCMVAHRNIRFLFGHFTYSDLFHEYIKYRNEIVSKGVDEDPHRNVTEQALMQFANYSLYYNKCDDISRKKARHYTDLICRGRMWSNSLLNWLLKENLVLATGHEGEYIMFGYQKMGDFLMADIFKQNKMSEEAKIDFVLEKGCKREYFSYRRFLMALLSDWELTPKLLEMEKSKQMCSLILSCLNHQGKNKKLIHDWIQQNNIFSVQILHDYMKVLSFDIFMSAHQVVKKTDIVNRDIAWSAMINEVYANRYHDEQKIEVFINIMPKDNSDKEWGKVIILLCWMCTTPHPFVRGKIMRKLVEIFEKEPNMALFALSEFYDCNDPYVMQIIACAIYGHLIRNRNSKEAGEIAELVLQFFYENHKAPEDILIRQWTMLILAFADEITGSNKYFGKLRPPFDSPKPSDSIVDGMDKIDKKYFGVSKGSWRMYETLYGFSDFNRYILGTNGRDKSCVFMNTEKSVVEGIPLVDIMLLIANIAKHNFKWNDELGKLDDNVYSEDRYNNLTERFGKKYLWLALFKADALLSDHFPVVDESQYVYSPKDEDIVPTPYPWNTNEYSRMDPSVVVPSEAIPYNFFKIEDIEDVENVSNEQWMSRDFPIQKPRLIVTDEDNSTWIVLTCYDGHKTNAEEESIKDLFLFSNAAFIGKDELEIFKEWAKEKNFYGRWMPERRNGSIEYLWNEYPWAETYKRTLGEKEDYSNTFQGKKFTLYLSYEAQLQEDWLGFKDDEIFLREASMPNHKVMNALNLYTAERGVTRDKCNKTVVARNFSIGKMNGLAMRKDFLERYLENEHLALVFYSLGEKYIIPKKGYQSIGERHDLSGAYYLEKGKIVEIQPMHISNTIR